MPGFSRNAQLISGSLLYRISPKFINKCRTSLAPAPAVSAAGPHSSLQTFLYQTSWHADKQFNGCYGVVHRRAWSAHQALLITVWRTPWHLCIVHQPMNDAIPYSLRTSLVIVTSHVTVCVHSGMSLYVSGCELQGSRTRASWQQCRWTDRWLLCAGDVVTDDSSKEQRVWPSSHIARNWETKI
jgi:hypothetical protein